jgi:hypothetical protein
MRECRYFFGLVFFLVSQVASGLFVSSQRYSFVARRFIGEKFQILARFSATSESHALKMFLTDFPFLQRLKIKAHIQQARLRFFHFLFFLLFVVIFYAAFARVIFAMAIVASIGVVLALFIYFLYCLIDAIRYPSTFLEKFKDYPFLPLGYDNIFNFDDMDM